VEEFCNSHVVYVKLAVACSRSAPGAVSLAAGGGYFVQASATCFLPSGSYVLEPAFFLLFMSRSCLLLASCLLLPALTYAQLGVRAGATSTSFHIPSPRADPSATTGWRVGYHLGVFYELPLAHRLSLVPELSYSRENLDLNVADYRSPTTAYAGSYRLTRSYLNLPLLLRATVGPCYVEAGPQATYLVGGREAGHEYHFNGGASYTQQVDRAATARYQRFDGGVCVGVGVKLPAGLGLSLRAYQGLRSLALDSPAEAAYTGRLLRRTLQASLSYPFKPAS
jgi:hypothetical protein